MIYLLLSIFFSVLLLINFRLHPRFQVNTFQAIILNYPVCIITGLLFLPQDQHFSLNLSETSTQLAMLLGVGFVITFMLSGFSTQKIGMATTSLANNMSLVVPVIFSLIVLKMSASFDVLNYTGLALAIIAVVLSTVKKDAPSENSSSLNQYWWLPVAVFTMYGITNTSFNYLNATYVTKAGTTIPFTLTILVGSVVAGGSVLLLRLIQQKEVFDPKSIIAAIPLGIPNFLSFYYLLKALDQYQNNGAFVLPMYNIGVIVGSALVAFVFFKEKFSSLNKIGLLLAILAIVLISHQSLNW